MTIKAERPPMAEQELKDLCVLLKNLEEELWENALEHDTELYRDVAKAAQGVHDGIERYITIWIPDRSYLND